MLNNDFLQLKCCGSVKYTEWFTTPWGKKQPKPNTVPQSCCTAEAGKDCVTTIAGNKTTDIYTEVRQKSETSDQNKHVLLSRRPVARLLKNLGSAVGSSIR